MSSRSSEWSTSEGQLGAAPSTGNQSSQQQVAYGQQQRLRPHQPLQLPLHTSGLPGTGQQQRLHISPTPLSSHYYYASASPGHGGASMNHQQQPRQPPSLNIAAAAAVVPVVPSFHQMALSDNQSHSAPYSAPANASSSFYNGSMAGHNLVSQPYASHGHAASFNGQVHHPVHHVSNSAGNMHFIVPGSHLNSAANIGHPSTSSNPGVHAHHQSSSGPYGYRFGASGSTDFASGMAGHSAHYDLNPGHSLSPIDGALLGENDFDGSGSLKVKRKQVKNACVNCQKACKRCDEGRPCSRCVKYGLTATCTDSARKERKRGIKRGPYKRRATTGSQPAHFSHHHTPNSAMGGDHHMGTSSGANGSLAPMSSSLMTGNDFSASSTFAHQLGSHHSSSSPPLRTYFAGDSNAIGASSFELSSQSQAESNAPQYVNVNQRANAAVTMPNASGVSYDVNGHGSNPATSATFPREGSYVNGVLGSSQYTASTMPPPGTRTAGRHDYDITSGGGNHQFASSLYSNVPAVHQTANRSNSAQPGSAPAASTNFAMNAAVQSGMPLSHRSGFASHVFTPNTTSPSTSSAPQGSIILGPAQGGVVGSSGNLSNISSSSRLFSDSNLATLSNGSGTTASTIHSPRTPGATGSGMLGMNEITHGNGQSLSSTSSPGGAVSNFRSVVNINNGGLASSYMHHPRSSTFVPPASASAGAFFNAQPSHSFSLHLPHSARFRGSTANSLSSLSSTADLGRPRSAHIQAEEQYGDNATTNSDDNAAQRALPLLNQASDSSDDKLDWQNSAYASNNTRYQLPSPRMGVGESRSRPLLS